MQRLRRRHHPCRQAGRSSAGGMRDPAHKLPRAMFTALAIVIAVYLLVSSVVVMTMRLPAIPAMEPSQGHVLSEAAREILGRLCLLHFQEPHPRG